MYVSSMQFMVPLYFNNDVHTVWKLLSFASHLGHPSPQLKSGYICFVAGVGCESND